MVRTPPPSYVLLGSEPWVSKGAGCLGNGAERFIGVTLLHLKAPLS